MKKVCEKKRIVLLGPTHPYRGGIAHHTTLLCKALCKQHEVCFISFSRQYPALLFPGRSDKDPSETAVRVDNVEYLLDSLNPWTWLRTARRIARFKPELLIMPWWVVFWAPPFSTIAAIVKRLCGARVVLLCHNVVEHEASWVKAALSRFMLSQADRIVTQSGLETQRVRQILGQGAPVVTGFHPTYAPLGGKAQDSAQARRDLGVAGRVLLFFGFVRPYKGLDILLDALPAVLAKREATLFVVGEFWKDKELYLEQIARLRIGAHVKIIDAYIPNEEIARYFSAADLVVQPYRSASGSGICQLAYGMQKPVIASRIGNLDDVIADGVNGRLVAPEDSGALAQALIESLDSQVLAEMTRHAACTRDRFSWEKLAALLVMEDV